MSESRLTPSLAKRFRSGRACLDFAHTAATQEWVEPELVYDEATLERWLGHVLGDVEVEATASDVAAAHTLRAAVLRLARARAAGQELDPGDVRTVNDVAAAAPPVPQLTPAGVAAPMTVAGSAGLSAIARDAIDLFGGPLGHRIRECAAADCAYLFVDTSRPGTRRWCSMERCGNLAKIHTHRDNKASQSRKTGGELSARP
jgi:predicted RNA-binding Zn ribbon-like protein